MRRTFYLLVLSLLGLSVAAQENIHFLPSDRVSVRQMRDVPAVDIAPGVHMRTVVGATGSFSLADFDSGSATTVHHHTREQLDVGITGVFEMPLGNHTEPLGPDAGVIIPPNVSHAIANKTGSPATLVEFHTVPRPDLVPPRPAMTFPAAPQPAALERRIVQQLGLPQGANATTTVLGETCTMIWRTLKQGTAPMDVHPAATRAELFVYVVRGDASFTASGREHRVGPGALVVIPAAQQNVNVQAVGAADLALLEFTTERR